MTITRLGQLTAELNTTTDIALYGGGSANPVCSTTNPKSGSFSYESNAAGPPFGQTFPATTAVRCGLWHNHMGASGSTPLLTIAVGAAFVRVTWEAASNQLRLQLGFQAGTSMPYLPIADVAAGNFSQANTWRHIAATYKCHATAGFFSLYVDGLRLLTYTGTTTLYAEQGTAPEAAAITGIFAGGAGWADNAYVDDFYFDSIVSELDHTPPTKRFLFCLADRAGTNAQWKPLASTNISQVKDPTTAPPDGDATYVAATAAYLRDTFGMATFTLPPGYNIHAVLPVAVARKTDSKNCKLKLIAFDGANSDKPTEQALTTTYRPVCERLPRQPDGTVWDETGFNAVQMGYESAGSYA